MTVGKYLLASYCYYCLDINIMEDTEYDHLCRHLLENFDSIRHPHKHLLSKEALEAGSGYHLLRHHYPPVVQVIGDTVQAWQMNGKDYLKYLENKNAY